MGAMGRVRRVAVALGVVAVLSLTALPAWASSSPATHRAAVTTRTKAAGHCHHAHKSCPHSTGSVTGTDGGLTVTFSASETGRTVNFAIAWTETKAYGAVGPEVLSFGREQRRIRNTGVLPGDAHGPERQPSDLLHLRERRQLHGGGDGRGQLHTGSTHPDGAGQHQLVRPRQWSARR